MKRRHLSVLASVALMAVGLAGCSNDSGSDPKTLRIAGLAAGDHEAIVAVGKLFTKQTGIKVKISEDGSANYGTTLRTQLGAGTAPDVFFVFPGNGQAAAMVPLAKPGFLADLTSVGFESKIPEAYKDAATYEGKPYVVPQTQGLIGVIYNQTALDDAGLTAPKTFPDLLKFCADAQAKGKSAFALGFADEFIPQMISYALTATLVYGSNPEFGKQQQAGDASFAKSDWKKAFEEYVQMNDAKCFEKDFQGTSFADSATMVAKGDSLGIVGVNAFLQQVSSAAPEGTTLKMEPLPATDDASETRIPAAFAAGYGVNAKAKNMSAAIKFAKLLASPEGQELYAKTAQGLPVFISDDFKPDPVLDSMVPFLADQKFSSYPDQAWPSARVGKAHATVVSDMVAGRISVDEALKQMDDAYKLGAE